MSGARDKQTNDAGYRTLIEASTDGLVLVDAEGVVLFANPSALRMLNREEHELLGAHFGLPGVAGDSTEVRLPAGEGGFRVAEIRTAETTWHGEDAYLCVLRDVTQRKEALEDLGRSEEQYRLLAENTLDCIWVMDLDQRFTYVNPAVETIFGYTPEEFVGSHLSEHCDEVELRKMQSIIEREIKRPPNPRGVTLETALKDRDGKDIQVEITGKVLRDDEGAPVGLQGTTRDITERKLAEDAIRRERDRAERYLDVAGVMILALDPQGRVKRLNRRGAEILQCEQHEALAKDWFESFIPEHRRDEIRDVFAGLMAGMEEKYASVESTVLTATGEERIIRWHNAVLRNDEGQPIGTLSSGEDVTELKKAQSEIHRFEWLLERDTSPATPVVPAYGDLTELNTERTILDSVGADTLQELATDAVALLDTSVAIYERNGDYAYGLFVSEWCGMLDEAGRKLCGTSDNREALRSGEWLCHENCWNVSARAAMEAGEPTDIQCVGGIHLYAVPITAGNEVIGVVNIGYGNPPTDDEVLAEIASRFCLDFERVRRAAHAYKPRPPFITEMAKRRVDCIAQTIGEIVARRQAEQALRRNEAALRERNEFINTLLDNLPIGIAVHSLEDGTRTYINPQFGEIYGWPEDELSTVDEFFEKVYPDPDYRKRIKDQVMADMKSGDPDRMVWVNIEATGMDGTKRIVTARNIPLPDQGLMISTVWDVTEHAKLEEQLRQSQKLEAIGRLAGGVAHDFNNILTGIKGCVVFALRAVEPGSQAHDDLETTLALADRAADLTGQLLAFSRRQTLQVEATDLNDLIASEVSMLKRLLRETINLQFFGADELPKVRVDSGQMSQVIMNLAVNARDAMPRGGKLTIETAVAELDEEYAAEHVDVTPGRYVMLAVSDTGVGMSPEQAERVFEPFFTTKDKSKGTGLGLATVHGIVKQHGGHIAVYSEPGEGTTFKIYLPISSEAPTQKEAPHRTTEGGMETILIVEDEQAVLSIAGRILEPKGYEVLPAGSAEEARRVFDEHGDAIDLLLTDVILPDLNGRELYEELSASHPALKVLFMSGYTDNAIVHHGVLDDDVEFMQKPFTPRQIARRVREVLDG